MSRAKFCVARWKIPCVGSDVPEMQVFCTLFDFPTHYLTVEMWHPDVYNGDIYDDPAHGVKEIITRCTKPATFLTPQKALLQPPIKN